MSIFEDLIQRIRGKYEINNNDLTFSNLLEPALQGMGAPQSIETTQFTSDLTLRKETGSSLIPISPQRVLTVPTPPHPLPATPPLSGSVQEHAGVVYATPIPTSLIPTSTRILVHFLVCHISHGTR